MAYENVRLEEGEEKVVIVDNKERIVKHITIDYGTGNYMFKQSENRNAPEHIRFEIVIKGIVVDLWFYNHFEDDPNTMIWTLERFFCNGNIEKKVLFEEIRKAVETYGCWGSTKEMNEIFKKRFCETNPNGFGILDLGRVE